MKFFTVPLIIQILFYTSASGEAVIENSGMRLTLDAYGNTVNLIRKPSGQECRLSVEKIPAFSITRDRPCYVGEMLALPTKKTTFYSNPVCREDEYLTGQSQIKNYEYPLDLRYPYSIKAHDKTNIFNIN